MIKLQALENFTLERFNEIQDIQRAGREQKNWINKNDTFKCSKDLADYLLGDNPLKRPVVKVLEVEPKEVKVKLDVEYNLDGKTIAKQTKTIKKKGKK